MSDEEKKETLKESKILEALNHPNIVKFREVYKTKKGRLCIVMEYADGIYIYLKKKQKMVTLLKKLRMQKELYLKKIKSWIISARFVLL
jgi:serine/threonine protein kinase